MMSLKRILLIKLRYIGDVVLTTPLLPLLTKWYPSASLTFLVNGGTEGVLQGNPYLREVLVLPRENLKQQIEFIYALRQAKFDAVLDLTDGDRSAFLSLIAGASLRVGYNREGRWRGKCYTHVVSATYGSMHMVDYHAQALRFLGISEPVEHPRVFPPPSDEEFGRQCLQDLSPAGGPLVLLCPAARYRFKAWAPSQFAALADRLAAQGVVVALIGNRREYQLGQQILALSRSHPFNMMGQTSLSQLAGLMKQSALFIGNDGGPMHMAGAVGCPVLGLFGPTDPAVWGARGKHVSVISKHLDCQECFHPVCQRGEDSCMGKISLEEVFEKAQDMLSIRRSLPKLEAARCYGKAGSGA